MEVHHHAHTERKKFTHYLWEFLMLFLAVFCGFLAENQREHLVEHNREKQFMISLVEDLETDTTELQKAIRRADSTGKYADSALYYLLSYKFSSEIDAHFTELFTIAGQRLTLINTDRTSSQLKNSGAMRLIRNKKVVTDIIKYWRAIDESNITLERYLIYRNAGRELSFKLFIGPQVYQRGYHLPADSVRSLKVFDTDVKKWDELINLVTITGGVARNGHLTNLKNQYEMAVRLIALINKEYHLN